MKQYQMGKNGKKKVATTTDEKRKKGINKIKRMGRVRRNGATAGTKKKLTASETNRRRTCYHICARKKIQPDAGNAGPAWSKFWSLFLSPSESDVRQWQGAASEARPSLRWVVFVLWPWGRFGGPC